MNHSTTFELSRNSKSDDEQIVSDCVFLKSHVKIELLVCRWLAWSYLISPVQHAMNIAFRHLPIMRSFVSNPKVHVAASKDPKMIGGPFVDLPESAVPEVKELIRRTESQCAKLIAFAQDYRRFDKMLQDRARGYCLDDFYGRLPASLAGLVELAYDLNNHPSMRIIEEIVYLYGLEDRFTQEIARGNFRCRSKVLWKYPTSYVRKHVVCRTDIS